MRFLSIAAVLSLLFILVVCTNDGLQDVVTWDQYSININGSRVFVYSAEFHYQRMPVPEMWLDIFQKFRANGFNAVSIYFFWSYHSAAKGVYDFETSGKNLQRLFGYAKEAGLYIIARPGPYSNAETNGGGLALWGSDGSLGLLRTSNGTYFEAWQSWVANIGKILAENQITNGGPIILNQIENELQETTHLSNNTLVLYMEQIEEAFRDANIVVPFISNEKGERSQSWSTDYEDVGGAVNMYGLDAYPGGLSCTNSGSGFVVIRNYYQWFKNYSNTQPNFFPEFEGGYFTPWGGSFYDDCASEHEPAFADVFYKNNIGQRTTLQNLYMAWGGTNWGHSAAPVVYTSYDYSAPLRETREIRDKMSQTKLISLFTRVSSDLLVTEMVGNGTGYSVSSIYVWSWVLRNPDTGASFTVIQQNNTASTSSITFDAYLSTTQGAVKVPDVNLDGRQSKILVTDYSFGSHTLLYSSSDILTYGIFNNGDAIVFYLVAGQIGQFAFKTNERLTYEIYGPSNFSSTTANGTQTFKYTQSSGKSVIQFSNGVLMYLLEQATAWKFWAPTLTGNPYVSPDQQIFVLGPYLVRNTTISDGIVYITGDNANTTTVEVYSGDITAHTISWNGFHLPTIKTPYDSLVAVIYGVENSSISLPKLQGWKSGDSLPEKNPIYDDSRWTTCNKTTTLSPISPLSLPVLFSSDYEYYVGAKIYRGYFTSQNTTSVNITCSGGLAFGWNAWLNGVLIGGNVGNASLTTTSAVLSFPDSSLTELNVLTVVVDYHGHDETSTAKGVENPRGILGAQLLGANNSTNATFVKWKIQGNAGGSANIDPVRGPMNEGGLYGERMGWHLPGFNTENLLSSSPLDGLISSGIGFFVTTFNLDIDDNLDVPIGIELSSPMGTHARIMIFVNGYQYGKFVPQIGPQTRFPIPPGVINNRGSNTLAISLWAQTDAGAKLDSIELFAYGVYETAFKFDQDWSYLQPRWDSSRSQYV